MRICICGVCACVCVCVCVRCGQKKTSKYRSIDTNKNKCADRQVGRSPRLCELHYGNDDNKRKIAELLSELNCFICNYDMRMHCSHQIMPPVAIITTVPARSPFF